MEGSLHKETVRKTIHAHPWRTEERLLRLERILAGTIICLKAIWTVLSAALIAVIIHYFTK
jgi:hypothetical protein